MPGQIDVVEDEGFESRAGQVDPTDKSGEVGVGFLSAVFLFHSRVRSGCRIKHFVKSTVVIDSFFSSQETLVDLLGVCRDAEKSSVLLYSHQEALRTRRSRPVVDFVGERLAHVGLVAVGGV